MYYINVYDLKGKVAFSAVFTSVASHWQTAHYKHGLTMPDYAVFQSKDAADADAEKRK